MRHLILIFGFLYCANFTCLSQSNNLSFGLKGTYHWETRTRTLQTELNQGREIHSSTDFYGFGIVLKKKFANSWSLNTGLNYVRRQYNANVYFDQSYWDSDLDLRTVGNYGYKTVEVPFGVSKHLLSGDKWGFSLGLAISVAIDFQSYYFRGKAYSLNELHLFSSSLIYNMGLTRTIIGRMKVAIEPFIRIANIQRDDPILILSTDKRWTYFDNWGFNFMLLYSL